MLSKNKTIVIIGASGAIGSEFVKQFAENNKILAFSRSNKNFNHKNVESFMIDIENENSIKDASAIAKSQKTIDMVIVASGILHNYDIMPEKSLKELSITKFQKLFQVNAIGPAIIAKYFIHLLNKDNKAVFAALSARIGSINDNRLGGWYSYRASKAALNMILKTISIESKRINKNALIIGLHPGTVDSYLSNPFQSSVKTEKLFSPEFAVKKLINVIENKDLVDSGLIFDYAGKKIEY